MDKWFSLQRRHNECDCVANHQPHDCLLNRLFRRRSKETSKLRVTGLCEGNSPVTGEFPAQRGSNAEKVSIWWCHHTYTASNTRRRISRWIWYTPTFHDVKLIIKEGLANKSNPLFGGNAHADYRCPGNHYEIWLWPVLLELNGICHNHQTRKTRCLHMTWLELSHEPAYWLRSGLYRINLNIRNIHTVHRHQLVEASWSI